MRYTAPAASAGVPARPRGIMCSIADNGPGLTPTLIFLPSTSVVWPSAAALSQACLDETERNGVDGDVISVPFLGQCFW